jgi:hypothetical protein
MKKLILISALLFSFNGWAENESRDIKIIDYEFLEANDLPTDGKFQLNYPNGKPYLTGELMNDHKQGTWKFYFENGKLQAIEKYDDGRPVGIWKYYNENGKLSKRIDQLMMGSDQCRFSSNGIDLCGTGATRTNPYDD